MNTNEHLTKKLISIVVPIYCEEDSLCLLIERLNSVTGKLTEFNFHYVLVNDGSSDGSWGLIKKFCRESSRVVGIDLSRNFGKEIALSAGVHYAKDSDAVICIDADLQHPPELISQLIKVWSEGVDMVTTIRRTTDKVSFMRKFLSHLYYWIMSHISDLSLISQTTDYRLYDRKVVDAFCRTTERGRNFRGLMDWMGFERECVEFEAPARIEGTSTYSYKQLWRLAINSITHFSLWPLRIIGYIGLAITSVSGILVLWMLVSYVLHDELIYTPLAIVVVVNTLLIGIILIAIGLIALYIGTIHTEVINRPLYVIRETVGNDGDRPLDH